ncbi:hypothetical protein Tco_1112837 [Tanacetum coccineum]|uniref:Uncharacterized protein n=1 Tax=Tanacetum coccineum TaxID=301880 RepID=A0ABQ5IQP0_9ASTR
MTISGFRSDDAELLGEGGILINCGDEGYWLKHGSGATTSSIGEGLSVAKKSTLDLGLGFLRALLPNAHAEHKWTVIRLALRNCFTPEEDNRGTLHPAKFPWEGINKLSFTISSASSLVRYSRVIHFRSRIVHLNLQMFLTQYDVVSHLFHLIEDHFGHQKVHQPNVWNECAK